MESIVGRNHPVGIIGGGISGWSLAIELARQGITSIIVDVPPVGQYATTSNQGWWHSGALYLAKSVPDEATAAACREGGRLLDDYGKGLAQPVTPCYFLFYHEEEREGAIKRCLDFEIAAEAVAIKELKQREPLLQGSPLRYAMRVADTPVDSARLLEAIARHACNMGVQFSPVSSLETLQITQDGDSFSISLDSDSTIECQYVAFACGTLIPNMLERLIPGKVPRFRITKNPVLSLSSNITLSKSMLIVPNAPDGLSLVPFERPAGSGISICTLDTEELITDYHDRSQSNEWRKQIPWSLAKHFPAMKMLAQRNTLLAHIHVCQKLHSHEELASSAYGRPPLCLSYALEPGGPDRVFALYPGKMTSAFVLARMCADKVLLAHNEVQTDLHPAGSEVPDIAKQPYGEHFDDQLVLEDGNLVLKKPIDADY